MPLTAYVPMDLRKYKKDAASVLFSPDIEPGQYVFVQDVAGRIWVLPDRPHGHPFVLGRAQPVVAAGELLVAEKGRVESINNYSGTFACQADCLLTAVGGLIMQGARVRRSAISAREE